MFEDVKNGIVSIKLFGHLDSIAERNGVKDYEWAKATGIHSSRISEWRRIHKEYVKSGQKIKIRRAFTADKSRLLLRGLRSLLGDELVRKELLKLIDKAEETEVKIMLLLNTCTPDETKQLWLYMKALKGIKDQE